MKKDTEIKRIVKDFYSKVVTKGGCCSCGCKNKTENKEIAKSIGYSEMEIAKVGTANLGLGCGNPTALAHIKEGETVLDLGSGAGFDCLLAADKVGTSGRVIGVDMTEKMVSMARRTQKIRVIEISNLN